MYSGRAKAEAQTIFYVFAGEPIPGICVAITCCLLGPVGLERTTKSAGAGSGYVHLNYPGKPSTAN